jgi:hypothetical protein
VPAMPSLAAAPGPHRSEIVWWGAQHGRAVTNAVWLPVRPATRWMRVVARASSSVSAGQMVVRGQASSLVTIPRYWDSDHCSFHLVASRSLRKLLVIVGGALAEERMDLWVASCPRVSRTRGVWLHGHEREAPRVAVNHGPEMIQNIRPQQSFHTLHRWEGIVDPHIQLFNGEPTDFRGNTSAGRPHPGLSSQNTAHPAG